MEDLADEIEFYLKDNMSREAKNVLISEFLEQSREKGRIQYQMLIPYLKGRLPLIVKRELSKYIRNKGVYKIDASEVREYNSDEIARRIVRNAALGRDVQIMGANNTVTQVNARDIIYNLNQAAQNPTNAVSSMSSLLGGALKGQLINRLIAIGLNHFIPGAGFVADSILGYLGFGSTQSEPSAAQSAVTEAVQAISAPEPVVEGPRDRNPAIKANLQKLQSLGDVIDEAARIKSATSHIDSSESVMSTLTAGASSLVIDRLLSYGLGKAFDRVGK